MLRRPMKELQMGGRQIGKERKERRQRGKREDRKSDLIGRAEDTETSEERNGRRNGRRGSKVIREGIALFQPTS